MDRRQFLLTSAALIASDAIARPIGAKGVALLQGGRAPPAMRIMLNGQPVTLNSQYITLGAAA